MDAALLRCQRTRRRKQRMSTGVRCLQRIRAAKAGQEHSETADERWQKGGMPACHVTDSNGRVRRSKHAGVEQRQTGEEREKNG